MQFGTQEGAGAPMAHCLRTPTDQHRCHHSAGHCRAQWGGNMGRGHCRNRGCRCVDALWLPLPGIALGWRKPESLLIGRCGFRLIWTLGKSRCELLDFHVGKEKRDKYRGPLVTRITRELYYVGLRQSQPNRASRECRASGAGALREAADRGKRTVSRSPTAGSSKGKW